MSAHSIHSHQRQTPHNPESRSSTRSRAGASRPARGPKGPSPLAVSVTASLARSGKWSEWAAVEPRLAGFASFEEVLQAWRRSDDRCYQVVAGLTAVGSRRGRDDDDAALAVVVLLEDGIVQAAIKLHDVCELDDVSTTVWEEVKSAEPQMGCRAAHFLLQRAHQRLTRRAAGMIPRLATTSLEKCLGWEASDGHSNPPSLSKEAQDRDLLIAAPEVEDPVADLTDLLVWARDVGVIATNEIDLLVELLAADHEGMAREDAQRLVGARRGVGLRTIRRRRDAAIERLRDAAPQYLAATA